MSETLQQVERAFSVVDITIDVKKIISKPKRVIQVNIPVKLDNGSIEVFTGYRVQHNDALGPFKGGIRFHPELTLEEVHELAFLMALKCAACKLPYGGAKGGVKVDTKEFSEGELERISRGYIRLMWKYLGKNSDVPAPDMYTNEKIMGWMADEFETLRGHKEPGFITGKPILLGGSQGRGTATAKGAFYVLEEFAKKEGLKEKTVAVQGFGNAGTALVKFLQQAGYKVVAVSDSSGALYDPDGIKANEKELEDMKAHHGSFKAIVQQLQLANETQDKGNVKFITNSELLELNVEVLIPAAMENQITKYNASRIKAPVIIEVANGPVSYDADLILEQRGIKVVPDIIANAGGVIVSYLEWVQNNQGIYMAEDDVNVHLKRMITTAFNKAHELANAKNVSLRMGAYGVALQNIATAIQHRL